MTITGVHPYADKFPMLPEPELAELAESIRANGLRNPIVLTPDGLILDGRNRAAACERVGVAVAAGVLSVGLAGTVQAAPKPDGWGGSARVKASKSVAPVDVNGLRRTPRM